jgi:flagellar basal-body rod protein FlgC
MKNLIILTSILLSSCSKLKNPSDIEIEVYCQDLNVLYQRIAVIQSNIANVETTRTPEGGPYKRKIVESCSQGFCKIVNDSQSGIMKYDPKHPDADKNGYVAYPNITLEVEKADELKWSRVAETVFASSPVAADFFFKDPRAKGCFNKYPNLKEAKDYSEYLGRKTN